jgi:hypothetical protein
MEPKGGRKRPENKLQGVAVQDQAIQPGRKQDGLNAEVGLPGPYAEEKIVIQYGDHTTKGTYAGPDGCSPAGPLRGLGIASGAVPLRRLDTDLVEDAPLAGAKAIYFVRSFDGNYTHDPLHFHNNTPVVQGLWVRIRFLDDEVMEGLIANNRDHVLDKGFFMVPTDPGSNNKFAYILKDKLKDFEVLGMRDLPKGMSLFGLD